MNNINLPGYIDNTNFKFLNIDEKIIISLNIDEYQKYTDFIQVIESIPKNMNYDMSMYIKKLDTNKVLKEITYKISSSNAEIKTINNNQVDIDVINNVKDDAINLRKEIQVNNQEIFNLSIIITFYSNDFKDLIYKVKLFQSSLYSKGLNSSITNFRHLDSYILSLPLNNNFINNKILNESCFTTDSLSLNFPFYTKNIFDLNGIIFGFTKNENKICNIDIFNDKYLNSNMCILGSSGSGKSYFTKLLIIRHFLIGKRQYIFDLEGEYTNIAKNTNQKYIDFSNGDTYTFNLLEIFDYEVEENNWLNKKIDKISLFLSNLIDINDKEVNILKEALLKTYSDYDIIEDISSLYEKSTNEVIYINNKIRDSSNFPTIVDLVNNIKSKKIKKLLIDEVINKYKSLSKHSNFSLYDKIVVFNTSNLNQQHFICIVKYFLDEIKLISKNSKIKSIIYIDEIWKYINIKEDNTLALTIFEYYKTLRKYNSSIISITQDITDFFSYDNGNYGKSILNNCGFKMFFRVEFSDRKKLENMNIADSSQIDKIYKLNKGQGVLNFCNNSIVINIKSSEYEEKLMEVKNEYSFSNR